MADAARECVMSSVRNPADVLPQLIRPAEAARRLAVDTRTLNQLCAAGAIPYQRIGGVTRFDAAKLAAWLERNDRNNHAMD